MKKIAIYIVLIISLFLLFLIYDFMVVVPTITVENVRLIDAKTFKEYERSNVFDYAVNENESRRLIENNIRMKEALITFNCDNSFFFNTFYEIKGVYANPKNLPPIIVGEKPDMAGVETTNIYSRMHKRKKSHFNMTVLIDPKNYSDLEILEMLKTVEVMITEERKGKINILATLPIEKH